MNDLTALCCRAALQAALRHEQEKNRRGEEGAQLRDALRECEDDRLQAERHAAAALQQAAQEHEALDQALGAKIEEISAQRKAIAAAEAAQAAAEGRAATAEAGVAAAHQELQERIAFERAERIKLERKNDKLSKALRLCASHKPYTHSGTSGTPADRVAGCDCAGSGRGVRAAQCAAATLTLTTAPSDPPPPQPLGLGLASAAITWRRRCSRRRRRAQRSGCPSAHPTPRSRRRIVSVCLRRTPTRTHRRRMAALRSSRCRPLTRCSCSPGRPSTEACREYNVAMQSRASLLLCQC